MGLTNCDELTLSTTMTAWISTEESLSLMILTFAVLCMAKKSWFRREKVRMRSWMLRRENRQLSCLYCLGATNSLHYKDSRTTHICNIHWEPCILDQVLKHVTQSAYRRRSRNIGNHVFLIKKLESTDILKSILFWRVLHNLHTHADPVTLGIMYSWSRNWRKILHIKLFIQIKIP